MKILGDNSDVIKLVTPTIGNHTIPLFKLKDGIPKLHGTGVLIKTNEKHFLVSAAHCLEKEHIGYIIIPLAENKLEKIGSRGLLRTSIVTTRKEDKIDLVICQFLSKKKVLQLEKIFTFLKHDQIESDHIPIAESLSYFVMGFPSVRTKTDAKKKIIDNRGMAFLTKCSQPIYYNKYGFEEENSILVEYPKKIENINNQNKNEKSAEPYGVSGGGLWKLEEKINANSNDDKYKLIGILIEFQKRTGRVMIATKVKFVLAAIQQLTIMNLVIKE